MRDHGGNIDWAIAHFGGAAADWIDLSTGINRAPYPIPTLPAAAWTALPTKSAQTALIEAARQAYHTQAAILPLAGAQAAIQMLPRHFPTGTARIITPTYNEHAANLRAAGWQVEDVAAFDMLEGADLAVVVNPNNPDGRSYAPDDLLALSRKVGHLIVDESFADPRPALSVAPRMTEVDNLIVLRSFGKFYGLAGLRLGFALGPDALIATLSEIAGPWPVCGAALEIGRIALLDRDWQRQSIERLQAEVTMIDQIAKSAGWTVRGGTELFRLYETPDAGTAQNQLARAAIWSRIFPWSERLIRLGLPGSVAEWQRLERALKAYA